MTPLSSTPAILKAIIRILYQTRLFQELSNVFVDVVSARHKSLGFIRRLYLIVKRWVHVCLSDVDRCLKIMTVFLKPTNKTSGC